MNTEKRIKQCLKAAPKPPTPDSLLDKLQGDVSFGEVTAQRTALRRWFAPAGGSISPWRLAGAATIAILVLLPLSYGATKAVKYVFTTFEAQFEYPEENVTYGVKSGIASSNPDMTEEDALNAQLEFQELARQGKVEEVEPGSWGATLSDGSRFGTNMNPELFKLSEEEREEKLEAQFDEVNELRKAGEFEKTYKPEMDFEVDGVKYRFFEARFVLSDGTVMKMGSGEPATEEDQNDE